MKRIWIVFLFTIMCGLTTAFGQLRVANNFGQDLNVSINGTKILVPNKGIKTFPTRSRTVYMDCATLDGKNAFTMTKEVSRAGVVTIESSENRMVKSETTNTVSANNVSNNTPVAQSGGSLAAILQGGKPANTNNSVSINSVVTTSNQNNLAQQSQTGSDLIRVVYSGSERFKVFSDLGGSKWQGIEFRGKATADSIQDNAKNEYILCIKKDKDIHIGVIFNPSDAINEYGEFRKRVNQGDAILYINEGDIKKMSTSEKKDVKIKFMAKDYKLLFDPKDVSKDGKNTLISMGYNQLSRRFLAPIGQFYLKASCTNVVTGMFYPTVYIPVHVISSDNTIIITTEQIQKATAGADLNLKWSTLQ